MAGPKKLDDELLDPRSTGRKRARKVLEESGRDYKCECAEISHDHAIPCGHVPKSQSRSDTLDANHKNKNWLDNDPANLEWLCRTCHREKDRRTDKGVSSEPDEFGYGLDFLQTGE